MNEKYIAALDVGTTTIRCFIYDSKVNIIGSATDQIILLYPQPGHVEIDPDTLWLSVVNTIQNAIADAKLTPSDITCLGISTQRSTFITWDRTTGKTFHNFITWKDLRADDLVKKWNSSFSMKGIRYGANFIYLFTRSKRFLAGSVIKLMNTQSTLRLNWVIQNNQQLQEAMAKKTALFGTLDSWLLYKLRQGTDSTKYVEHISDITNCTATGFFDPFTLGWAGWAIGLFNIKIEMLPKVVDNSYNFGYVDKTIFGEEIRIGCTMADQSASMWGSCCFNKGDVKVTMGTGSFLNLNSGSECHASVHGLYPLVAWKTLNRFKQDELVYCVEGASNDTGSIIQWAIEIGLFSDASSSSDMANSVTDSDGVFFIPAFSGLGAPTNDHQAATGFIGMKPSTRKEHLVRAVLESLTFRVAQLYVCTLKETNFKFSSIKVDGGVSKNNFICQFLADLTGLNVERSLSSDMTVLGVGFLAGLNTGVWNSTEDLIRLRKVETVFHPRIEMKSKSVVKMELWEKAVERFKGWYNTKELNTLQKP